MKLEKQTYGDFLKWGGTPKSSILIRLSILNMFKPSINGGTTMTMETTQKGFVYCWMYLNQLFLIAGYNDDKQTVASH